MKPTMRSRAIAAVLAAALGLGCASRAATIRLSNGRAVHAVIEHSDASALHLRGPNGNSIPLGQLQVAEIDHPGNRLAIVGMCLIGGGLLFLVPAILHGGAENSADASLALVGLASLGVGVPMLVHNGLRWHWSKAGAAEFEAARTRPLPPAPPAAPAVLPPPPEQPAAPVSPG
jgi:hypothetical protein